MQRELRVALTAMLAAVLVIDPATACHYCGYYSGYSAPCGGYSEPASCCGGYEYEVVDCGSSGCDGGCGCDSGCGCDGSSSDAAPQEMYDDESGDLRSISPSGTSKSQRPVDQMPAPELPPRSTPPMQREPMPPAQSEPITPPQAMPPADDLFDSPSEPMEEPEDDMFEPAETPITPPAEEPPAPADDMLDTDDRYAPPPEEPSAPADDDMFAPLDDEPAAPATTDEPTNDDDFDSFFDAPTDAAPPAEETPIEEEAPADEEEPAAPADDDDIFNFGSVLREPGGFASTSLRRWIDNTGQHSCRGRLLRVLDGKVQLLKDTGRTTTVPFNRLSQSDLTFVNRQASAQSAEAVGQTAQVTPHRAAQ